MIDITGIKSEIKNIFTAFNTTTALHYLSQSLTTKVNSIMTRSPNTLMFNSDVLPAIAIFPSDKSVQLQDICKNQIVGKRKGIVNFEIAAFLWNSDHTSYDVDNSDNDIEKLMENIEEVLRHNPDLNGYVTYQHPTNVTYHDLKLSEEENYKVGMLTLQCVKMY